MRFVQQAQVKLETTPVSDSRIDLKFVRTELKVRMKTERCCFSVVCTGGCMQA